MNFRDTNSEELREAVNASSFSSLTTGQLTALCQGLLRRVESLESRFAAIEPPTTTPEDWRPTP